MEKEGKEREKQTNVNYWIQALLGWGVGDLVYLIAKLAKKEKPTLSGLVSSGMAGSIGTPLAVWGIPKLLEVQRQAQRNSSFRQVAVPSYASMLASITPVDKTTSRVEIPPLCLPATPRTHEVKHTNSKQYPWLDILPPGSVTLIIGKPGSGKSALGYFLLERLHYRTSCYVVNLPKRAH